MTRTRGTVERDSRRRFSAALVGTIFAIAFPGCAVFKGGDKKETLARDEEFEIDEEDSEEQENVFKEDRKKQTELEGFFSQKDSTKKGKVRPGDDFLLSNKAKEIYANTER